jgi:signal transduction histidine kinase
MPVPAPHAFPSRTERTIVVARIVLAASSLFAVWLDPNTPQRYVVPTYTLHTAYAVYAIALALIAWNRVGSGRWPIVTHLADIGVCALFQGLSLGPSSSPFFTYFVFSLFCGALRWGWRGTLRTAALVLTLFLLMGFFMSRAAGPDVFDLNRFVIRAFYLAVIAGLLLYLGQHEAHLRRDIERLARWPLAAGLEAREVLVRVLGHAAQIIQAGRAVLVWETGDEPWVHVARWSPAGLDITRHGPGEFMPLVPDELAASVVLSVDPHAGSHAIFDASTGAYGEWRGAAVHENLLRQVRGGTLLSAPIVTEELAGRVFFTDLLAPTAELTTLAGVVAREIGTSLGQMIVTERLREIAASDERLLVARDLHDGVLQSLTGIRLELQSVAAELGPGSPPGQLDRLRAIERTLAIEQRELRMFINGLKPRTKPIGDNELRRNLDALGERIGLEWKVPLTIRVGPRVPAIPAAIERAVVPMIHEAVVNALKHGDPSRIRVDVDVEGDALRIVVGDDGHGFPFRGRYDHAALAQAGLGPASLRDRSASLGGTLAVESDGSGSRVEIVLPLEPAGAA